MAEEKLAKAQFGQILDVETPWDEVDILEHIGTETDYYEAIEACLFFYKHDGLASNVINKLVEIGINEVKIYKNDLRDNEYRIFEALTDELKDFAEKLAYAYLLTGLAVPEIIFGTVTSDRLRKLGIKKREILELPVEMYVRDPMTISIKKSPISSKPMYYIKVSPDLAYFITSGGSYPDGTKDKPAFEALKSQYPDFVSAVKKGETEFPVSNPDIVISRHPIAGDIYPVPYLYPALEPLRHKRNLRRMDYALASRIIAGILHIKVGNDKYPLIEGEEEIQYGSIKDQLAWQSYSARSTNRIFQLYTNHTVELQWVIPDSSLIINSGKYDDVNRDIIFALGFPRVLITGEAERTGTTDPLYATTAPIKTMENFRKKILKVLQYIVDEIALRNNLSDSPTVAFEPIQLAEFSSFANALFNLYTTGNISRETLSKYFGVNWQDETSKMELEKKLIEEKGINEFAPVPFSPKPTGGQKSEQPKNNGETTQNN